jgi:hypothetical protein
VFGKKDNTNAIELSDIAAGIGGFVIIGESAGDYSGHSVSSAGDVNGDLRWRLSSHYNHALTRH